MTNIKQGWFALLLSLPLIACQPSQANNEHPQPKPSKKDLAQALNGSYQINAKSQQECLGRLTFNLDGPFRWALSSSTTTPKDQMPIISRELRVGGEKLDYGKHGGVFVLIYPGATQQQVEADYEDAVNEKIYLKKELAKQIELLSAILDDLKKSTPATRDPNISQKQHDEGIAEREKELIDTKKVLAHFDEGIYPMDFGMPDRKDYAQGRYLRGYLMSNGVYYHFVMGPNTEDKRTSPEREAWFTNFMKRFQPRKLYDIPKERGVCVPYGFIPDDGSEPFYTAAGVRFDDRPNVVYMLRTQVVDDRPITNTLLEATSRAAVGLMPGFANEEVAKLVKKHVGPHRAYIGELAAEQGGTAVQLTEDKRTFDNYSVFTGYNGWMGSHVLPFISVDMRSFTQAQTARSKIEKLKTDPPPFEESKARLDALLKSIRLRPTDKPMPEFQ